MTRPWLMSPGSPATGAQVRFLSYLVRRQQVALADVAPRPVDRLEDLTQAEAASLIDQLRPRAGAR